LIETVTLLAILRAIPNESNPGPILAVVPGTETVTEDEFIRMEVMISKVKGTSS